MTHSTKAKKTKKKPLSEFSENNLADKSLLLDFTEKEEVKE